MVLGGGLMRVVRRGGGSGGGLVGRDRQGGLTRLRAREGERMCDERARRGCSVESRAVDVKEGGLWGISCQLHER